MLLDLERGTVTVVEQLLEVNGAFSVGPPKNAAGRRTVTLPAVVVEALAWLSIWRATRPSRRRRSSS